MADDNVETEMLPKHVKVVSLPCEVLGGITSAEGLVSPRAWLTVDVFPMPSRVSGSNKLKIWGEFEKFRNSF